ncbi:hypothetical protein B0H13DRAFT_1614136 [Mycena leptocephala]|nr:hypothetical protein B0H13DRAFT_1614136 [Mycena leptocephala]
MLCRHTHILLTLLQLWSSRLAPLVRAQQQTFFPAAVPLAVRTPTFNCWLDMHNGTAPMAAWPKFWNGQHTLGWAGYIKVDGAVFHWLGDLGPNASTWLATQVTPTRTIFTVKAGPMELNVTFLSPVEPSNWVRQSFPFSYVYIDGKATDGQPHSIQLYSDISAEWVSNSLETGIRWNTSQTAHTMYHQVNSTAPTSVFNDVAEDSVAYYAMSSRLREQFAAPGAGFTLTSNLTGQAGNVQARNGSFPAFAHAVNLGTTDTISTVAWAVGVIRDPIVTFEGVQRKAYYWSQYATIGDAIDDFMVDFPAARTRAIAFDHKILQDAAAVSQDYVDLVSLGTRQAMAGIEITLTTLPDGSFNLSDVKAFMKDVGNSGRVNPTEAIYAALPAFMYLNASITGALLEPLLAYQSSTSYKNSYAAPDLGLQAEGVTCCIVILPTLLGNMLILVLAHARSTGDGSLIGRYYNLLKQWADYLGTNALIPGSQYHARDTSLAQTQGNFTNLALKGIIAIQAMSEISQIMGQTADAQKYGTSAKSCIQSWTNMTSVSGRLRWTYGGTTSGLMYNLLADKLLQLNFVPSSVRVNTLPHLSGATYIVPTFGFPLSDDSNSNARSDWTLFSAAASPDIITRNLLISTVRKYASSNFTGGTFPTVYNVQTGLGPGAGVSPNGFASPAQGAMFSVLALNVTHKTVVVPSPAVSSSSSSGGGASRGAIVGAIVGGLAVLLLVSGVAIFLRRRNKRRDVKLEAPRPYQEDPPNMAPPVGELLSDSPLVSPSRATGAYISSLVSPKARLMSSGRRAPAPVSPPSPQPGRGSSLSRATEDLRSEMGRLRQEVEQLRAAQDVPQDAPPGYY